MEYVDEVLCSMGGADAKLYSTASSELKTTALRNNLHLLEAKVRHLGTDRNVRILGKMFEYCEEKVEMKFYSTVEDVVREDDGTFTVSTDRGEAYNCEDLVLAMGRSGSKQIGKGLRQNGNRTEEKQGGYRRQSRASGRNIQTHYR